MAIGRPERSRRTERIAAGRRQARLGFGPVGGPEAGEAALDLIGGKWKTMILALLMVGTIRFNQLQKRLKGVTHRVLTAQLRDLEATGLVRREVYPEVPPRVEYSLTDLGRTLGPLIDELTRWGTAYALRPGKPAGGVGSREVGASG